MASLNNELEKKTKIQEKINNDNRMFLAKGGTFTFVASTSTLIFSTWYFFRKLDELPGIYGKKFPRFLIAFVAGSLLSGIAQQAGILYFGDNYELMKIDLEKRIPDMKKTKILIDKYRKAIQEKEKNL